MATLLNNTVIAFSHNTRELDITFALMKILQVIPRLARGGAEKVVIDLLNSQNSSGMNVSLFCLEMPVSDSKDREVNKNIKTYLLGRENSFKLHAYFLTYKWIKKNRELLRGFDVIHTHLTYGLFFGAFVRIRVLGWSRKSPKLIFTSHLVGMKISKTNLGLHRLLAVTYDKIVLMARDAYWERVEAQNKKYVFIQNGIEALERTNRKQNDIIQIGTLSRLAPERTPELFLEYFSEISKITPKIEFIFGGDGPQMSNLKKLAHELNISGNTFFLGLIEQVPAFYDKLDYYITLNVGPTTGIAGLEAISSGIPTIAIQLDKTYESGESDWIASFLTPAKASEFLSNLIADGDSLLNYVQMQKIEFHKNFTCDIMTSKYLNLYRNL